jgi:hypothetical protein
MKAKALSTVSAIILLGVSCAYASSGTEGADFLDIPVGAEPAALGSAYTALATDAYAPVWNPAGLAVADGNQLATQYNSYLESMNYEFLSFVHPLAQNRDSSTQRGIGVSAQYLGSGDITRTDIDANGNFVNPGGSFSSHYASYNVAYGQTLTERLSMGVTGKLINAAIDNVSANAYAADIGTLYKLSSKINLAGTLTNLGTQLKFIDEGDSLPMELHLGGVYRPTQNWRVSSEVVYPKTGLVAFHAGMEWSPLEMVSLRAGFKTDTLDGLSPIAGFTMGLGLHVWGQEFAYAWVPYGDLGDTQYFSLLIHFGERSEEKRNLIQYQQIKGHRTVNGKNDESEPELQQLMQLLSTDEDGHVAQSGTRPSN